MNKFVLENNNKSIKIPYKGINYDTGTRYTSKGLSSEIWNLNVVEQDMNRIKNELNCNSVAIFGSEPRRLIACMKIALQYGLSVWIQPRVIDSTLEESCEILNYIAKEAENLKIQTNEEIVFNIGCENSIFSSGIIPGRNFKQRILALTAMWWKIPVYNKRLNEQLLYFVTEVRKHFSGKIIYSAGSWEDVNWESFDYVGSNYYWDASNRDNYESGLQALFRHKKPVVITEFGCCCFQGAAEKGGGGFFIINFHKNPPQIKGKQIRNESVQVDYLSKLLKLYDKVGIYGVFVFTYMEPTNFYSPNPKYDLDMASYGIVQAYPKNTDFTLANIPVVCKQAYNAISELYGSG